MRNTVGDKLGDKRSVCILPILQHGVLINEPVCPEGLIPTAQELFCSEIRDEPLGKTNERRKARIKTIPEKNAAWDE